MWYGTPFNNKVGYFIPPEEPKNGVEENDLGGWAKV